MPSDGDWLLPLTLIRGPWHLIRVLGSLGVFAVFVFARREASGETGI